MTSADATGDLAVLVSSDHNRIQSSDGCRALIRLSEKI
jgi:hypothetical protein